MKEIYKEYVWKEDFPNIGKTVRVWMPYEHKDQRNDIERYVAEIKYFTMTSEESIAEYICENFDINAVEVKHSRTDDGVVYYVNWP